MCRPGRALHQIRTTGSPCEVDGRGGSEGAVPNLPMCKRKACFLFKSVITAFSSGYLSVYSSLSALSIPVRDRNSCTFFSNCLFSFTENLPNLMATPRSWGRRRSVCRQRVKANPAVRSSSNRAGPSPRLPGSLLTRALDSQRPVPWWCSACRV